MYCDYDFGNYQTPYYISEIINFMDSVFADCNVQDSTYSNFTGITGMIWEGRPGIFIVHCDNEQKYADQFTQKHKYASMQCCHYVPKIKENKDFFLAGRQWPPSFGMP